MSGVIVKVEHARKMGYCLPVVREFCALHNIDYKRFIKEGIPLDEVKHIKDAMLQKVLDLARKG